jgi:hypothetical protein
MKAIRNRLFKFQAAATVALFAGAHDASAAANDFSTLAGSITTSLQNIPGLLTAVAYLFGILIGVLGILKIKDHVENPSNTPLKDGAIRLAAGGALFALPMIYEAMFNTVDENGAQQDLKQLYKVKAIGTLVK